MGFFLQVNIAPWVDGSTQMHAILNQTQASHPKIGSNNTVFYFGVPDARNGFFGYYLWDAIHLAYYHETPEAYNFLDGSEDQAINDRLASSIGKEGFAFFWDSGKAQLQDEGS